MFYRKFISILCLALLALPLVLVPGCNSSTRDLLDLALNPPERRPIDQSRLGVNNFFVDPQFGSIEEQFSEIRDVLGIRSVRVLLSWNDSIQPTPSSEAFYNFYDEIVDAIPAGVDVILILVNVPSWMADSSNWIDGDPRKTFVERWVRPTVTRYAGRTGVIGWQIWNEPDQVILPADSALGLVEPANYADLLSQSFPVVRTIDPTRLIILGASRSIQQSSGQNLDYNKNLRDLFAEDFVDIWAIHYYGQQFEEVIKPNGVADFLNSLRLPIWITESGQQGPTQQRAFVETTWPFLRDNINNLDRIYYYQFGETTPIESNFGLRNSDPSSRFSDLYLFLSGQEE